MLELKYEGNSDEILQLITADVNTTNSRDFLDNHRLKIIWFTEDLNEVRIDGEEQSYSKNQIIFLTEFHQAELIQANQARILGFNRPFYCVLDNDDDVGCKGILFYGAAHVPMIEIPNEHLKRFEILWQMFSSEMDAHDHLQLSMLQTMLTRYLILCTRLFQSQSSIPDSYSEMEIIREFNYLVEKHFKTKHHLADYAHILNKSPKTISNIFAKLHSRTPSTYIRERILLECKRLLCHSDKQVSEIAYEVGYNDVQTLSRFFKSQLGVSPKQFRNSCQ